MIQLDGKTQLLYVIFAIVWLAIIVVNSPRFKDEQPVNVNYHVPTIDVPVTNLNLE